MGRRRGQLVFKGETVKKTSKTTTQAKAKTKANAHATPTVRLSINDDDDVSKIPKQQQQPAKEVALSSVLTPTVQEGMGHITTSGTVVMGHGTSFLSSLTVGDAILQNQEMRVITMCLSNTSINLSSSFSHNITQPSTFQYICKPKQPQSRINTATATSQNEIDHDEKASGGIYGSHRNELVYRESTENGSYRIKREIIEDENVTRTNLLEMRAKKKRDKYC